MHSTLLALTGSILLGLIAPAHQPNPATVPIIQDGDEPRHLEKVEAARRHAYPLLMIGDSIINILEFPEYKSVWDQYYSPLDALNLGFSGARTENILWNLTHGELDGQSPKVVVLLIGSNNSDDANFPTAHTPEQIAEGTKAIIKLIQDRCPEAKILLLHMFPRGKIVLNPDGTERGDHRRSQATVMRASEICAKLADNRRVFFLDVHRQFLRPDGSIDQNLMPDLLHPSPEGARLWAEAMHPLLVKLLGKSE